MLVRAQRRGTRSLVWRACPRADPTPPVVVDRSRKLVLIGSAAGLFSGLFGVGGGTIIVPLLVLWLGYGEHEATGTSLAAIVFIAAFGAAIQGAYGNLHVLDGVLIGVPAIAGVLIGTWLQQRLATRSIALLFAAVLVAGALELLLE